MHLESKSPVGRSCDPDHSACELQHLGSGSHWKKEAYMETRELTAVETETVSGGAMTIDFGYVTLTFNFAREGAAYLPTSSAEICDNSHHCTSRILGP
jgi:hypothetical protein